MRRLSLTLALTALLLPAFASAAGEGKYVGKIKGDDTPKNVHFKVVGNKVKKFEVESVTATCYPLTAVTVFVPEAKIKNNKFSRNYKPVADSDHVIKLRGKFDGNKASGTIEGGPTCQYNAKWSVRKN